MLFICYCVIVIVCLVELQAWQNCFTLALTMTPLFTIHGFILSSDRIPYDLVLFLDSEYSYDKIAAAIAAGNSDAVRGLLKAGAKVSTKTYGERTNWNGGEM